MRIVSVNCSLDEALRQCGHEVFSISLPGGLHALRAVAGLEAFIPDAIVQQEHLGYAAVLSDLPSFSCIKAFWSVDTHINLYWHRYYARLFDVFFTPHRKFCAEAPPHWQHPNTHRLPAAGFVYPWKAHASRAHAFTFVGRLTAQRPTRKAFVDFLQQRYGLQAQDNLAYAQMLQLYGDTRILPNETIAFETNFRLLEGASCGCCVLSPDIGEDQNVLLEPGREVLVYADALECMDLADFCLRKPTVAENIAHMAQQRILAEHLPQHRAVQMVQALQDARCVAAAGRQAGEYLWCSLAELELTDENNGVFDPQLWEADCCNAPLAWGLRARWARRRHGGEACVTIVREALHAFPAALGATRANAEAIAYLAEGTTVLGLATLHAGEGALARDCWAAFQQCRGKILPVAGELGSAPTADTPLSELALEWAGHLYPAGRHWYQALEMLSFVSGQDATNGAWARAWIQLGPVMHHFPLLALSALARLSLNEPDNPHWSAAYVAENIRAFRVQEAQDEVRECLHRLANSPAQALFWQALQSKCKNISRLCTAF